MKYFDKLKNKFMEFTQSKTNYLLQAKPNDAEAVFILLNQNVFSINASTANDGMFILQTKSEMESLPQIEKTLTDLMSDKNIKNIEPAVIDQEGFLRYVVPGSVIVKFKDMKSNTVKNLVKELGSVVLREFRGGLYEIKLPPDMKLEEFVDNINQHAVFAEPNFYCFSDNEVRVKVSKQWKTSTFDTETQPSESQTLPWNLQKIFIEDAWKITKGTKNIVVAVIDGKPDFDHEALVGKFIVNENDDIFINVNQSSSSHATNICSVIAGESEKISGIAPGIYLLPIVVDLNLQTYADRADAIYKVLDLAREKKVGSKDISRVILSCSWKTSGDVSVIRTTLEEASRLGIFIVCSAGNTMNDFPHYPSDYSSSSGELGESVISVAATDKNDQRSLYSNFSKNIDVSAPGGDGLPLDTGDILVAEIDNTYSYGAGTSLAVPHVASLAALMLSIDPHLTTKEIKTIIMENVDQIPFPNKNYNDLIGIGRINAHKTLNAVVTGMEKDNQVSEIKHKLQNYSDMLVESTGWTMSNVRIVSGDTVAIVDLEN